MEASATYDVVTSLASPTPTPTPTPTPQLGGPASVPTASLRLLSATPSSLTIEHQGGDTIHLDQIDTVIDGSSLSTAGLPTTLFASVSSLSAGQRLTLDFGVSVLGTGSSVSLVHIPMGQAIAAFTAYPSTPTPAATGRPCTLSVAISPVDASVAQGKSIPVTATISNSGDEACSSTTFDYSSKSFRGEFGRLSCGRYDVYVGERLLDVPAQGTTTVDCAFVGNAGSHALTFTVTRGSQTATGKAVIRVQGPSAAPTPVFITGTACALSVTITSDKTSVEKDETAKLTATIRNSGDEACTGTSLTSAVNPATGTVSWDMTSVDVPGMGSATVDGRFSASSPGTYSIAVVARRGAEEETGGTTIQVRAPETPTPRPTPTPTPTPAPAFVPPGTPVATPELLPHGAELPLGWSLESASRVDPDAYFSRAPPEYRALLGALGVRISRIETGVFRSGSNSAVAGVADLGSPATAKLLFNASDSFYRSGPCPPVESRLVGEAAYLLAQPSGAERCVTTDVLLLRGRYVAQVSGYGDALAFTQEAAGLMDRKLAGLPEAAGPTPTPTQPGFEAALAVAALLVLAVALRKRG